MLTPTTVGCLKLSLKCVMRWGLHHQCPGYVVVSVTEQAYQHLTPLNTLEELSHFHLDHLLSELDKWFSSHKKPCFSRSILGTISVGNRRSCNCVQCGDESGVAICYRPPNVSSLCGEIHNWYTKWKFDSNSLPSTLSSTLTKSL